jgi:hypothetical protein
VLDNKWKHGKTQFRLPPLSQQSLTAIGLKPMSFILDESVGPEIVLLITEPKSRLKEFEGLSITSFHMKAGLVDTSHGPVYWVLFFFPSPATGQKTIYECVVNPKGDAHLALYRRLAGQMYWHVVIADEEGEVSNLFEFSNSYGLSESLTAAEIVCSSMESSDFMAAKAEYQSKFSIDELLR